LKLLPSYRGHGETAHIAVWRGPPELPRGRVRSCFNRLRSSQFEARNDQVERPRGHFSAGVFNDLRVVVRGASPPLCSATHTFESLGRISYDWTPVFITRFD